MDIKLVKADNWQGIYIDGELAAENHSLNPEDILYVLGVDHEVKWADEEWLDGFGSLPAKYEDVK